MEEFTNIEPINQETESPTINIVDCIMGSGKTSAAINYINSLDEDTKVIYITPYLNEVQRIKDECYEKRFYEPQEYGTKRNGLKKDLLKGRNIVTTHALFQHFDDEIIELCRIQNYILFMDEVADVVDKFVLDPLDMEVLTEEYTTVDEETGQLHWKEEYSNYTKLGVFYTAKKLCENGCLYMYNNTLMIWMFPVKVFKAFSRSYILTYLFDAQMQKYYYDYYNIHYNYLYVKGDSRDTYAFTTEKQELKINYDYNELINIVESEKMNRVGDDKYALSKSWYSKNINKPIIEILKKNVTNFFTNKVEDGKASNNLWTVFKDYKDELKGKRYTKGYAPCTARATNQYKERTNVAYLVNRFYDHNIYNFFHSKNIQMNEDMFALSEMLQFIWRSAIRNGEPINLYIPSSRMRGLLKTWMDDMHTQYIKES